VLCDALILMLAAICRWRPASNSGRCWPGAHAVTPPPRRRRAASRGCGRCRPLAPLLFPHGTT
jgi:hypothetical protein